jgi:putative endonuclease
MRGYRIIGSNVRLGGVEVDLLCRRGETVVFCEVKEKLGDDYGDPLEMVNERKQRRLRRAAEAWLALHPDADVLVRFDVVAIRDGRLERVENAF